jgi:hypothetical protein
VPNLAALKSAGRAAIVIPLVFAFADKLIQQPQTSIIAAFGSSRGAPRRALTVDARPSVGERPRTGRRTSGRCVYAAGWMTPFVSAKQPQRRLSPVATTAYARLDMS